MDDFVRSVCSVAVDAGNRSDYVRIMVFGMDDRMCMSSIEP